mmetsp:Transcript_3052/g.7602  ORF Transcript_3052/g.7602 Transcript_3052/m.7602 type:complete len:202 (+) Transcript_3052:692-1297(+)
MPIAPTQSEVFERIIMHIVDATHSEVFRNRTGHAEGTRAETHAQPARPALIAVQKLEVMMAIVSSEAPRRSTPYAESHVATVCSHPLAKKQRQHIAPIATASLVRQVNITDSATGGSAFTRLLLLAVDGAARSPPSLLVGGEGAPSATAAISVHSWHALAWEGTSGGGVLHRGECRRGSPTATAIEVAESAWNAGHTLPSR